MKRKNHLVKTIHHKYNVLRFCGVTHEHRKYDGLSLCGVNLVWIQGQRFPGGDYLNYNTNKGPISSILSRRKLKFSGNFSQILAQKSP